MSSIMTQCLKCQQRKLALVKTLPWPEAVQDEIRSHICSECWTEWEGEGTKVINELKLKPYLPEHKQMLEVKMRQFFNLPLRSGLNPDTLPWPQAQLKI